MDGGERVVQVMRFGIKGRVKLTKRNVVTGKTEVREVKNLLLANFFDRFFQRGPGIQAPYTMYRCLLGTDNTPPQTTDIGLLGTELANSTTSTEIPWSLVDHQASYGRAWTFGPGVGTGTIGEIVLQTASSSELYRDVANNWVARVALEPLYEKGAGDELTIEWVITIDKGGPSWSGLTNGVAWTITMNNRQFQDFCQVRGGYSLYYYSSLRAWLTTTYATARLRVGSSNEPSDLANDTYDTIKGDELFLAKESRMREPLAFIPGSFYRDIRLRLEPYEPDGVVSEMTLYDNNYQRALCRITFDPPIDKSVPYRLDTVLRVALVQMEG